MTLTAPVVSGTDRPNGAVTAHASITVAGINFVGDDLTPTARLGDTACSTTAWLTSTSVACLVPAYGLGQDHWLAVTVNDVPGSMRNAFTFDGDCKTTFKNNLR